MTTQIFWVGYVDPDTRACHLTCGPYCHKDHAARQAAAMRCPTLPFEVFVQRIEAMQYSPDGPVVSPRRIPVPAFFLIFLVIFLTLIVR